MVKLRLAKGFLFVLAISLLMTVLVGCSSQRVAKEKGPQPATEARPSDTAKNSKTLDKVKVRVGDIAAAEVPYASYQIALAKGYFEEEGLVIEEKEYANGPMMMLSFGKGELDVAMAGITPLLQSAAQGAEMVIISSITKDNAPLVARKEFKTIKDLNGKKIGTPGLGTIQDTILSILEKKEGIKVKHVYGKITDLLVYFEKGEIDGIIGWEPILAEAVLKLGAQYIVKKPLPGAESCDIAVTTSLAREKPEVVLKLLRAYLRAMKFYKENPKEALEIISKAYRKPESQKIVELAMGQVTVDKPELDMPSIKLAVEDAISTGKIKKEHVPDVDAFIRKYIDTSFLDKAKKEIGF